MSQKPSIPSLTLIGKLCTDPEFRSAIQQDPEYDFGPVLQEMGMNIFDGEESGLDRLKLPGVLSAAEALEQELTQAVAGFSPCPRWPYCMSRTTG